MRISDKEKRILSCVELKADASLEYIQKQTGFREHTIRYYLAQLEEKGVIKKVPFIDVYPLGYSDYALYFTLASSSVEVKDALIKELLNSPNVSWLAGLGGDYQYGAAIYARNGKEVADYLDSLSVKFGDVFFAKSVNIRVHFTQFQRKYLWPIKEIASVYFGNTVPEKIDDLDRKILHVLANKNPLSHNDLAKLVVSPPPLFISGLKNWKKKR